MILSTINVLRRRQPGLIAQLTGRLVFCVSVLVFCLLLSLGVGIYISFNQQQLGEQKVLLHDNINALLQSMVDQETGLRGYITTGNSTFLSPFNDGHTHYTATLQLLTNETVGPDFLSTVLVLKQVEDRASAWSSGFADGQIATMQSGNLALARSEQTNAQGKTLFDSLRSSIAQLQRISDTDLASLQTRDTVIDMAALSGVLFLTILVVIWLWLTFTYFTQTLRKQLDMLQETTVNFGAGNLDARVAGVTDTDLADLAETFNTMAMTLQVQQNALRDRDILEQVSQLNTLLTGGLDLTNLMQDFLQHVLSLLDMQVAALYLYDAGSQQLKLFTTRGLRQEDVPQSFAVGEGLVGRSALDREPLLLTQKERAEESSFQVRTIAGSVLPASLYHLPLLRGNELLGVLAVGSVYPMSEQARNVLQVVASNMASAISNAQSYEHIQRQADELAARTREQERANRALRQQRDELAVLNGALEEANRARSQFLSTMSHELRTPLTSIIGFSQMLLRSSARAPINERQRNNIDRILKNAQHLLSLINNVLDLAKVEAGRMDVATSNINLAELLTTLVDETRSQADERKLQLIIALQDDLPLLETDPLKVRQIILNLLSNAIKFTERGSITVSAHRVVLDANHLVVNADERVEQVAISIADTGIGIPAEVQDRIFEAFYQVDNSNSRNYGGTGLGLSIVRELTSLLGGKVEVQSQQDQGTTFTLFLPVRARDRQSVQDIRLNTFAGPYGALQKALVQTTSELTPVQYGSGPEAGYLVVAIDDNPDVLDLITTSLEQSPYRVVGVQDATQAMALVQELKPSVVTLDIMMPRLNGWQVLHQLKSNPTTASIPVILLTVLEDRSAGYVLGADEYLVKPVAREELLSTLKNLTLQSLPQNVVHVGPEREAQITSASNVDSNERATPRDVDTAGERGVTDLL